MSKYINVFTNKEINDIKKNKNSIIIYNSEEIFFKYLDIIKKVIELKIPIYSNNLNIRKYLFDNKIYPKFTDNSKIKIHQNNYSDNINELLNHQFEISNTTNCPLIIKKGNEIIIDRLKKKLPTYIIKNKFNIWEIEDAFINNKLLYIDDVEMFIKEITTNFYISRSLDHLKERVINLYNKNNNYNKNETCVFFGMYNKEDINALEKHNGIKFVIWGGTDCNCSYKHREKNVNKIIKIPDLYHISISKDIQKRLNEKNIPNLLMNFSLVNKKLFVPSNITGESIFIYNGIKKGNEELYGEIIYKEVVKKLPQYNYIYSNELSLPNEKMPKIYAKCFIGLRLTKNDGNSNTVQEMELMKIPIIHNLSDYGLKWDTIDDIIKHILKYSNQKKIEKTKVIKEEELRKIIDEELRKKINKEPNKVIQELDIVIEEKKKIIQELNEIIQKFNNNVKEEPNKNIILIHSNINLNKIDGATIWWSNIINGFIKDGIDIIYISNYKIINNNNLRNIENISKLNLINPEKNLSPNETLELIEKYGNQVNSILLRSELILDIIDENWNLLKKTIIYGLDINLNNIKKLNNKYNKIWTQSEKLKNLFEINGINNVNIIPVIAYNYNFNLLKRTNNEIRLIYAGTLRDEENILEIIEEFKKINKENIKVILKIVYGKIHGNQEFTQKVNEYIKNGVNGITFIHNLNHRDTCYEIANSDIGICWRKNGYGDNGEISTKVKEYELYGLQVISNLNIFKFNSFDIIYFLYGAKVLNLEKKLNYINQNINVNNIIPFKCKKIEDVIDTNIQKITYCSDFEILENYSGSFKKKINELLIKLQKRITNKYQYGHINSFINLINNAKQNNLSEIIIFEDDVLFHKNIKMYLSNFNIIKKNADIIYFGASKHKNYYVNNLNYQCKNITGTFAIFLKNTVFDDYLELLNLNILPSDICLLILQEKYKTYVYEPNIVISDLDNSKITQRTNINELYKQFNWNVDNYINYENEYVLIVLPTLNRSENIENVIDMINNQNYKYYHLLIIDDGSNNTHKTNFKNIETKYKDNSKIFFKENIKNLNIANILNKGLRILIDDTTNKYKFFTWISDDNIYHNNFLEELIKDNKYFKYSSFNLVNKINSITKKIDVEYNIDSLINNFKGCASFMWTKEAIQNIGFYNTNIHGCEDWEYLIRTFKSDSFEYAYENTSLIDYIRNNDSLYIRENKKIIDLKNNIKKIYNFLNNEQSNIVYYSKTNYKILFQRPQQIMRFFDKTLNKVFIGDIENVEIDEKYKLLIVPYNIKECVFNFINNKYNYLYYTDSRLYNEITTINKYKKIYDLIDAPIDEFEVWKPNLENCVKQSDYVIYSHPDLVKYLNDIDNTKKYHYISNACDYDHFSPAKNRIGERPIDFPSTDKLILGYYGAFSQWLDFNIIQKYADEELYHIVMIGGINGNSNYNIRFDHSNITWLDHKSYDELPYYLSWFDKCFLPFKDCELTKYVNPCKLWEYMASEKEIIKYNVNMDCSKIITYDIICNKILNILDSNNLIANCIKKYDIKNELNFNYNIEFFTKINNKKKNNNLIIKDKSVIIGFSMIDYFFRVQRSQHLLRLCSENGYTVFYLKTKISKKTKDIDIKEIYPNLYEISLWCESDRPISVYSTDLTSDEINSLIECINYIKLEYNFRHFISYIANPFWLQVIKHINNTSIIFDCLDYTKGFNTHSEMIIKLEEEIIEKEYIIYTSPILKELTNCKHNNFSFIRNGCDFKYFNKIINNKNYEKTRKIVGYYGAISDWWDVDLLEQVIIYFPDVDFHFIGNVYCNNLSHTKKINELNLFPNVTFLGEIPYDKLDIYISKFDIGIIPFIINDLIKCTNPVKLYEMFSFGIPVVLTELPDVLTLEINNLCYISKNIDKFIENIKSALSEEKLNNIVINERIEYAKQNCWENRFELFNQVINTIVPKISIILLCWNNWLITKNCIESVLQNSNYLFYELIIINNGSTDETYNQLNTLYNNTQNIRIIHNDNNYGFAIGMNIGTLYASYDYIILLNNDTILGKDWLYPLVKPLILNDYGIGSPITNNCGNEVKQFIYFTGIDDLFNKSQALQKKNMFKVEQINRIPFFCPVLRKKDFFAIGMLDINYKFGGWEDDDIIHKLKIYNNNKQNYYTYGSFVYHIESLSMKQITTNIKWTHNNNNQQYFEKKWGITWIPPIYNIPKINIILQTNIKLIKNLITDAKLLEKNIFDLCSNIENDNTIIIKDTISDEIQDNEVIITINKENKIVLTNKFESFVLIESILINLYSFINTTLFCRKLKSKIVFLHIEKCGGSTFKELIVSITKNKKNDYYIDNIDYLNKNNYIFTHNILKNNKLIAFHWNINDIYLYLKDICVFNLTMIRNPIKRLISHYYHMIMYNSKCKIRKVEHKEFKPNIGLSKQNINFIIDYINDYGNLIVYRLGVTHNNFDIKYTYNFKEWFDNAILNISKIKYIFLLEDLHNEIEDYNEKYSYFKINYNSIIDNKNNNDIYISSKDIEYEYIIKIIREHNIILYDIFFYNHICDLKNKPHLKI